MKTIVFFFVFSISLVAMGLPQEYYKITNGKKSKEYFFKYILKITKKENSKILQDRFFVQNIYLNISKIPKQSPVYKRFISIGKKYELKKDAPLKDYLTTIDMIPNSLVLAQAAIESGWGKSRFTKEANNIFGHWTWDGNGLDPKNRDIGKTHQIRIFSSIRASIKAYMFNLNLGWGYKLFRKKRYELRIKGIKPTGLELAPTLINYSQQKEKYVNIIKDIIKRNGLEKYDEIN